MNEHRRAEERIAIGLLPEPLPLAAVRRIRAFRAWALAFGVPIALACGNPMVIEEQPAPEWDGLVVERASPADSAEALTRPIGIP